eukprot:403362747
MNMKKYKYQMLNSLQGLWNYLNIYVSSLRSCSRMVIQSFKEIIKKQNKQLKKIRLKICNTIIWTMSKNQKIGNNSCLILELDTMQCLTFQIVCYNQWLITSQILKINKLSNGLLLLSEQSLTPLTFIQKFLNQSPQIKVWTVKKASNASIN